MAPNGSVGGSINLMPKRAEDTPTRKVTLGVDNGHQWRQAIDMGQRFGENSKYGVRINASHLSGSGKLAGAHTNTNNVTIGLDVRGERYRASIDAGYVNQKKENLRFPLRIAGSIVSAVPEMNTRFSADNTFIHSIEQHLAAKAEYDINKGWTIYGGFGFRSGRQESLTSTLSYLDPGSTTNNVVVSPTGRTNRANSQMIGIKGKVQIGGIKHDINVTVNRYDSKVAVLAGTSQRYHVDDVFNIVWRSYPYSLISAHGLRTTSHTYMSGLAITEVLSTKDEKWQFILGARYQKIANQAYRAATGVESSSYSSSAWSPAFGIVHKFNDKFAMYANYIEGLQPGISVPYNDNNINEGQVFAPYKTKQKEVGFKYDTGKYAATLAFFTVDLPAFGYTSLSSPSGWYIFEKQGITRNRGVELSFNGELTEGTNIVSSFMFLDAKLRDIPNAANLGKQLPGRSRFTASVGIEQDIKSVKGLTLAATATYNSTAYIDSSNTLSVSPWIRWDLGARYKFTSGNTPLTLRADLYNVFNHNHWEAGGYRIYQGRERTLAMSITAEF